MAIRTSPERAQREPASRRDRVPEKQYTPAQKRRVAELRRMIAERNRRKLKELGIGPADLERMGITDPDLSQIEIK